MLRDALANSVKELYSAEQQQVRVLPKLVEAATSRSLRSRLTHHLRETIEQVRRLECVFTLLDEPIRWARCPGVLGILEECQEAIEEHGCGAMRDAAIIATAQRLDYYEMAAYGAAAAWAASVGLPEVAELLNQCLDEEVSAADELLSVAIPRVHVAAARATRPVPAVITPAPAPSEKPLIEEPPRPRA
jgi:ferritin-like metal-binding protein YciE